MVLNATYGVLLQTYGKHMVQNLETYGWNVKHMENIWFRTQYNYMV